MLFSEIQGEGDHHEPGIIPAMPGNLHTLRRITGLLTLILSFGIVLWGIWPFPKDSASIPIPPDHRMELVWPSLARVGDAASVRMVIEPERYTAAPLAGSVESNVVASARLEFAGLLFFPEGTVSQPLRPGKPLAFTWQYRPDGRGDYPGVAWLYLQDVPLDGSPETVTPVSAREIRIRTVSLFGLGGPSARLLGGFGLLVGGLLGLDGAFAWVHRRLRRQTRLHTATEIVEQ
jgi:hypothetical protein